MAYRHILKPIIFSLISLAYKCRFEYDYFSKSLSLNKDIRLKKKHFIKSNSVI